MQTRNRRTGETNNKDNKAQTELEMQEVGNVDVDGRWGREGGAGTRNRDAKGSNNLSHGCVQDHLRKQAQQTGGES